MNTSEHLLDAEDIAVAKAMVSPYFGIAAPGTLACAVTTFAAVQKGHLIKTRLTHL